MKLFFHIACMDTLHPDGGFMWRSIVGEIMDALKDSVLIDNCDIYRNHVGSLYKPDYDEYFNHDRVKNTQIGVLENFEYSTLKELWLYSQKADPEEIIGYIHTKGVSYPSNPKSDSWRNYLMRMVVEPWEKHIKRLKESKELVVLGPPVNVTTTRTGKIVPFSRGNWWWAKAKHLKTLPEPAYGFIPEYENSKPRGKAYLKLGSNDIERIDAWEQYDYFDNQEINGAYMVYRRLTNQIPRLSAEYWVMHTKEYNDLKTWDFFGYKPSDSAKLKRARLLKLPIE